MARRNIWEQIWESTEGPTVTVTIPRDHAESLLQVLAASLEQDMPDDGMDDAGDDMDLDSVDDLDFGGDEMGPPEDDGMDDMDMLPAGDDDDEEPAPAKRGPGRPPKSDKGGEKPKAKADKPDKKKAPPKKDDGGDDDDDEKKDESAEADGFDPSYALGESAFAAAARRLAGRKPAFSKKG